MDRQLRDLGRVADSMVEDGTIEAYRFPPSHRGKHPCVEVLVDGQWLKVRYSWTPRTDDYCNYFRQNVRRKVRDA